MLRLHSIEALGNVGVERISPALVIGGQETPVFVRPKPAFGLLVDRGLQDVPAELSNLRRVSCRREFERFVVNHPVSPVGLRPAFARNDFGAGAERQRGLHLCHADLKATKSIDDHAGLAGIEIEVTKHREFATALEMFEHSNHGTLLRDHPMAGTGSEAIENLTDEGVLESLRDHRTIPDRVSGELAEPLEI